MLKNKFANNRQIFDAMQPHNNIIVHFRSIARKYNQQYGTSNIIGEPTLLPTYIKYYSYSKISYIQFLYEL